MSDALIAVLLTLGSSSVIVLGFIAYFLAMNPEKVEKWAALINRFLSRMGGVFRSAHKRYVKYDLQGRINDFTKDVSASAPYLEDAKVVIEWSDTEQDKKAFLSNGRVILRLRRDDPEDLNFVHGAYWSVATRLMPKVKRYISPSQRQALDLYVTSKLIEKEKMQVIDQFLEHYLHPYLDDKSSTISKLYNQFHLIDTYGVFYPVLLQELYFLSLKVFGGPKDDKIIVEVTRLIEFLERVATRNVGEEVPLDFTGELCRFAIVIIGRSYKMALEGTEVYINYIKSKVLPKKVETIYLLGKYENRDFINEVCEYLSVSCEPYTMHHYTGEISVNGEKHKEEQYLVVLRTSGVVMYQAK